MTAGGRLPFTAAQYVSRLLTQVGTTESPAGSNRTPYGRALGLDGYAWCAMFAGWGFDQLGTSWRDWWSLPGTHWAYCPSLLAEGQRRGLAVSVEQVRMGDLVLMAFTSSNIAARFPEHIGVATGPISGGHIVPTVEGNTVPGDSGSQANGGGVFRRQRSRNIVVGVIRPPYAVPAPVRTPAPVKPATAPQRPAIARVLALTTPVMHGLDVAAVQLRVGATRDGEYGRLTAGKVGAFQRRYWPHDPSQWDRQVGPATAKALGLRWIG